MLWIRYRQHEDIPQKLYYDEWQTVGDYNGQTPLMLWKKYRPNEKFPEPLDVLVTRLVKKLLKTL